VFCLLAILLPTQMMAQEVPSAMLYTHGSAWLNGSPAPKSVAVFSGDMLQTQLESSASLQSNGSNVMVLASSVVKFEGPTVVEIEHGAVRVTTSREMAAHVGDVTVKPVSNSRTEFQVIDVDGRVQIAANKGDLAVQDDQGTTTVTEGQQTTRDDTADTEKKKKKRRRSPGAAPAASGGIMSSPEVVYGSLAIAGGVTIWVLTRSEPPASPSCPSGSCP
jgi:hypothetical protein